MHWAWSDYGMYVCALKVRPKGPMDTLLLFLVGSETKAGA